jgi:hypothetical protein
MSGVEVLAEVGLIEARGLTQHLRQVGDAGDAPRLVIE